eukprot:3325209-Prorocentrum_lima.AAC.1
MTSSLVGSEMCIRDRAKNHGISWGVCPMQFKDTVPAHESLPEKLPSVSYTHLTLPTICSV